MRLSTFFLLPWLLFAFSVNAQIPAKTIPVFAFARMNGKTYTEKDLPKGKTIFFMFFDPGCDHCQRAMAVIGKDYNTYRNTPIILLSMEKPEIMAQFMNNYGKALKAKPNVTLLRDTAAQFISRFHPKKYPGMFLFDKSGKLLDYEDSPETVFRITNKIKEIAAKP